MDRVMGEKAVVLFFFRYMVNAKRNQENFQIGNRGPIWSRVVGTLGQDRVGHCEQEKGKGMHKGK